MSKYSIFISIRQYYLFRLRRAICFGFEEPSLQRDGCAAFEVSEAKSYEVHVLKGPEGYVYTSDEVFHTDENASDLTIVLKKAD